MKPRPTQPPVVVHRSRATASKTLRLVESGSHGLGRRLAAIQFLAVRALPNDRRGSRISSVRRLGGSVRPWPCENRAIFANDRAWIGRASLSTPRSWTGPRRTGSGVARRPDTQTIERRKRLKSPPDRPMRDARCQRRSKIAAHDPRCAEIAAALGPWLAWANDRPAVFSRSARRFASRPRPHYIKRPRQVIDRAGRSPCPAVVRTPEVTWQEGALRADELYTLRGL